VLEPAPTAPLLRKWKAEAPAKSTVRQGQLLTLTPHQKWTYLSGHAGAEHNFGQTKFGVFTKSPEALTNDFFINLLDMATV